MLGNGPACLSGSVTLLVLVMTGGVAPSHAQSPSKSGEIPTSERKLLAERFASERLWVWQKRLNLQEWDLSVVASRASELKPKTVGNIHWDREKKTAVIRVLDPADYHLPFDEMLRDDLMAEDVDFAQHETLTVALPIGQPTPLSNEAVVGCLRGPDLAATEAQFRALVSSIAGLH